MAETAAKTLSPEQLAELMPLLKKVHTVELKLTVPDADRRSAVEALGMDPIAAQIRQVFFFDTPDLTLNKNGVVVRVRRIQAKPADSIVKIRPIEPDAAPKGALKSPNFGIEVDAMPGGFVCSGRMKAEIDDAKVLSMLGGTYTLRKLLTGEQRDLYRRHAPPDLRLADLVKLGPINVLKLKFVPRDFNRKLVAELWNYPDGSRLLELSTKCTPQEAFDVAAETKVFLAGRGIDVSAVQETKTKRALEYFTKEIVRAEATEG
jgi:hypothetical protein